MSGETVITIQGNLTSDPELRFTPGGHAVAKFAIASTPRTFDKQTNEWRDGETLFLPCSAWRQLGEHVAESLTRGTAVIAVGRLTQRSYEKDGQKRTVYELEVDNIGPSLARATAAVTKASAQGQQRPAQQQNGGYAQQRNQPQQNGGWGQQTAQQRDPWATQGSQEPPF